MQDGAPYLNCLSPPDKGHLCRIYWFAIYNVEVGEEPLRRKGLWRLSTMSSIWKWIVVTAILCLVQEASCTYQCGKGITPKIYSECKMLPSLGASFAWTFNRSAYSMDFAFTEDLEDPSGWVAWGINPDGAQMVGTQALAAFSNTSGVYTMRTYNVTGPVKNNERLLVPGTVSVNYSNYSVVVVQTTVTIAGTVLLKSGQSTSLNLVWNRGPQVQTTTSALMSHSVSNNENLMSTLRFDVGTGESMGGGEIPNKRLKDIHGIINAISWGILLPIGLLAARYLRPFNFADPAWFYIHAFCQITGYAGGTAGWILGLRLQKLANPIKYYHRNLGIAVWALATLQILAATLLRPKPKTKGRPLWNVIHHTLGFLIVILGVVNIFEGIDLLGVENWKRVYITILICIGLVAVVLELINWFFWMQKKERRHKHSVLVGDT
ncbi:cytochrome b561 and DOMON domain-containing protein At5g47530 [Physcomitrium patens]|uniref:Cytochrome b561 and DOMON domain-containing protein n=3 Tax=Physcomitrium patens TaxID=3218 RepID=A0A2K1JZD9_PHYPA|nr:cytochrome b561 and DOMON domain-containing protein At4g17280-like [Physcomitrium patens]PNR46892.1 hypothetical protein PHYPA_014012 [Physcomitrium patens]|eukprot:XP_024386018.1 cytochrome b561 and DOMON domain-containing protein At4g17280-like [Physcomitrella patens]